MLGALWRIFWDGLWTQTWIIWRIMQLLRAMETASAKARGWKWVPCVSGTTKTPIFLCGHCGWVTQGQTCRQVLGFVPGITGSHRRVLSRRGIWSELSFWKIPLVSVWRIVGTGARQGVGEMVKRTWTSRGLEVFEEDAALALETTKGVRAREYVPSSRPWDTRGVRREPQGPARSS